MIKKWIRGLFLKRIKTLYTDQSSTIERLMLLKMATKLMRKSQNKKLDHYSLELSIVSTFSNYIDLLSVLSEFTVCVSNNQTVPVFTVLSKETSSKRLLYDWLRPMDNPSVTIDSFIKTFLVALETFLKSMEKYDKDNNEYYVRRSNKLVSELLTLAISLIELENK